MDRRYEARLRAMLVQTEVPPEAADGFLGRLSDFIEPFAIGLATAEQRQHTREYLCGLLSRLEHKTSEAIAYLHDCERQGLQKFIGLGAWDDAPLLDELAGQVGRELGEDDGVIVFDPSGFVKKGTRSVGVMRQWCGRVGKTENCQVALYMAYVSRREHALVDVRLYLPREWAEDRSRCEAAGVPREVRFRTRHELALEMLDRRAAALPHAWVAGDDEMGRPSEFRRQLRDRGERYLLAVPSNTWIRDLEAPSPAKPSRGPQPWPPFQRVDHWRAKLPPEAWSAIEVRDGEKGPLVVEAVQRRVQARTSSNGTGPEEILVATRERQGDDTFKHDYYLSSGGPEVALEERVRVSRASHRIEECLKRAKSESGLADYQVRTWRAWHHHQALALLAAWFLNRETRGGKNPDRGADPAADAAAARRRDRGASRDPPPRSAGSIQHALVAPQ